MKGRRGGYRKENTSPNSPGSSSTSCGHQHHCLAHRRNPQPPPALSLLCYRVTGNRTSKKSHLRHRRLRRWCHLPSLELIGGEGVGCRSPERTTGSHRLHGSTGRRSLDREGMLVWLMYECVWSYS
ncbi:hypothetical protein Hanom_Chr17g01560721 [Helianthus anomalus]